MGGGGKSSGSSSTTTEIDPVLKPLFGQTGATLAAAQLGQPSGSVLDPFMTAQPQFIPGATPGQQSIIGRQFERAFQPTFFTPEEAWARGMAFGFGGPRFPEVSALTGAGQAGFMTSPEAEAATTARGFGGLRYPEISALSRAPTFGQFTSPETMALGQIERFTGGEIGQSPVTQAAMTTAREKVLNDLTMAGLGRSGAVGTELAGAYAPILAEEIRTRAGVIPQLMGMGTQLRGGQMQAANLEAQIAERMRVGDVQGAQRLSEIGQGMRAGGLGGAQLQAQIAERMRMGDMQGAQILTSIGQAMRTGTLTGAQLQAAIGERMRMGDITGANTLSNMGQTMTARESGLLGEAGMGQEFERTIAAQRAEVERQEYLRRFGTAEALTLGVLGGFPTSTLQRVTTSQRGGGGK